MIRIMINRIKIWYLRDKFIREYRHSVDLHYQMLLFGCSYERKYKFNLRVIINGLKNKRPLFKEVLDSRNMRLRTK